jgi:hypothetical protein
MFRFKSVGFALICHAFALWPSLAHAQLTAPREASQIEFGPLSLYPTVQIIDAGIDTNVFNDAEQPKEDYTFTVSSAALAVLRVGANELMLESGGDYVWFRDYASERFASARYAMRFNFSASRFKPYVGAMHNRTRSRQGLEIDGRVRRQERSALGGFALEMTPRTSVIASMRFEDASYDQGEQFRGVDLAEALNRTGRVYSAGVRHALTPLTTLVVAGDYAENDFPQSHIRDSKSFSVAPALEFSPDAAIRGKVSAGVQVFQPVDPALPDYTGPVFSAALNWSLYAKTTLDIQATRNVSYSYLESQPYFLLTGVRASLSRPVIGPVAVLGGADWEYLSYQWELGVPVRTDAFRGDTTKVVFGGLRINVGRGFVVGLTAERLRRRSNVDLRQNFDRTRLLSSVTIGS